MQIEVLVVEQARREAVAPKLKTRFNSKMAKLSTFNRDASKVTGFVIYIQERLVDI